MNVVNVIHEQTSDEALIDRLAFAIWRVENNALTSAQYHKWILMSDAERDVWREKAREALAASRVKPDPATAAKMTLWHERHAACFPVGHEMHEFHVKSAASLRKIAAEGQQT